MSTQLDAFTVQVGRGEGKGEAGAGVGVGWSEGLGLGLESDHIDGVVVDGAVAELDRVGVGGCA